MSDSDSSTVDDLIAYSASQDGRLSEIAAVRGMGGVHSVIYGDARKYLGVANYHKSTLSTTSLPLASSKEGETQIQTLNFTSSMPHPGPNPIRQERPHPHQILLDPTGMFLLVPDLGADQVRVLRVQRDTGVLHVCEDSDGIVEAGSGPRHAVFLSSASASGSGYGYGDSSQVRISESGPAHGSRSRSGFQHAYAETLLLANELTNTLSLIQVSYSNDSRNSSKETSPTLHETRTIPLNVPNTNTSLAEIQVVNNFIYVSLRGDQSYAPNDSIAMLDPDLDRAKGDGMRVEGLFSAYGAGPRSFVVDQAGGLVVVGNQVSSSVVVLRRDPVTGRLGEMVAGLEIKGHENDNNASEVDGISCVVWDE